MLDLPFDHKLHVNSNFQKTFLIENLSHFEVVKKKDKLCTNFLKKVTIKKSLKVLEQNMMF